MVYSGGMSDTKTPLREGGHLQAPIGDGRHVRLTCTRPGHAYRVEIGTMSGGLTWRPEPGYTTHHTESEARQYAHNLTIGMRAIVRATST